MSLRFRGADLRPVLKEAAAKRCRIVLVKDRGVYWLAERGARIGNGRQKLIAYAVGCNPDIDPFDDWWHTANAELGGDDFAEHIDPSDGVFAKVLAGGYDLELSATPEQLMMLAVPSDPTN